MLGASCFGYFVVAVSMLPSIGASQASNARMAVGAGGQSSFVRRDGEDQGKTLQAASFDPSRWSSVRFAGCVKHEGSTRKKHSGAMKLSLCLLKAQFGGYEACGMEYPQGHAEDGVAECLLLAPREDLGARADDGSCQKELLMNLFPLGDANRVALYFVKAQPKPIAFSGCFKNEGDKRQEPNSGVKTLVDCVEEAAKQKKAYFGMEYPQGSAQDYTAQCVLLDSLPDMTRADYDDCKAEVALELYPLGGAARLAVYKVP